MAEITYYATVVNTQDNRSVSLVGTFQDYSNNSFENWRRTMLFIEENDRVQVLDVKAVEYRDLTTEEQNQFLMTKLAAVPVAQANL